MPHTLGPSTSTHVPADTLPARSPSSSTSPAVAPDAAQPAPVLPTLARLAAIREELQGYLDATIADSRRREGVGPDGRCHPELATGWDPHEHARRPATGALCHGLGAAVLGCETAAWAALSIARLDAAEGR